MAKLASLTSFKEGDRRKVINQGSRIQHWKMLFLGGFNSMFILNLVGLLGLLPLILLGYNLFSTMWSTASVLPFASSMGTGIITVVDTASIQHITTQQTILENLLLLPLAIIFSSILSSPFVFAMRNAEYDGRVVSYTNAIKGFKYCGVKFAILGVISAVLFEIIGFSYYFYNEYVFANGSSWLSIAMLVAMVIVAVFFLVLMVYAYVLTVTYKMSVGGAMRRAFAFTVNLPLQNICVVIATLLPLSFMLINSFMVSLVVTLYIFVGISYMMSVWMVYIQTVLTLATPQTAKKVKKG